MSSTLLVKRSKTTGTNSKITKKSNLKSESIEMVEETLAGMNIYPTKKKLWKNLPHPITYKTFRAILDHLEKSNKILYDDDDTIVWIFSDAPEHKLLQIPFL